MNFIFYYFHKHNLKLGCTPEEVWLQCKCGYQEDIPEERLDEAYKKLRNRDYNWIK